MSEKRIVIFGASGFVGQAACQSFSTKGIVVTGIPAPRLSPVAPADIYKQIVNEDIQDLVHSCEEADVVINAAGMANSGSRAQAELAAANSVLPGILARAAAEAKVTRFIHVSSAAVQGSVQELSDAPAEGGFSDYSWSKVVGERAVLRFGPLQTVVYRPASVQGAQRRTTRTTVQLAKSVFSSVAAPGTFPTPQALIENVGDAIRFLATVEEVPPPIVHHPSEGLTTRSLLALLGNREPALIPQFWASNLLNAARHMSKLGSGSAAFVRKLELLWFGQQQSASWLSSRGWIPPVGLEGWRDIGNSP